MRVCRLWTLVAVLCLLTMGGRVWGDTLPDEAKTLLNDTNRKVAAIQKQAEAAIRAVTEKTILSLLELQHEYEKDGKTEEAAALGERIYTLRLDLMGAKPSPGNLTAYRGKVGQILYFDVTGRVTGSVWGSDLYTDDSDLATVAVHAGILHDGQRGIVKVTIVGGNTNYNGSARNGILTREYGDWEGSYVVEAVR